MPRTCHYVYDWGVVAGWRAGHPGKIEYGDEEWRRKLAVVPSLPVRAPHDTNKRSRNSVRKNVRVCLDFFTASVCCFVSTSSERLSSATTIQSDPWSDRVQIKLCKGRNPVLYSPSIESSSTSSVALSRVATPVRTSSHRKTIHDLSDIILFNMTLSHTGQNQLTNQPLSRNE